MILRFLSRYGLATHLAVLSALPLALSPFITAATLGSVILWLTALAAVWLFIEPSVRIGEHLSQARARVRHELLLDPVFWVMLLISLFALIRWLNSGIALFFDAEQTIWTVKSAAWTIFPGSVGDTGYLPFASALALTVVICGIRHGIGLMARTEFGIAGSLIAGVGGFAVCVCASMGVKGFANWMNAGFAEPPFWASCFGVWLVLGIVSGIQAEVRRWGYARLPMVIGIGGSSSALLFFAPPLVAAAWFAVALAVMAFALCYLGRTGSTGAVARSLSLVVVGFALPVMLLMAFMPESVRALKMNMLDPAQAFSEAYKATSEVLSRLARKMWSESPWTGTGMGAFGLHAQFLAQREDWALIPAQPHFALNGYWTMLAERGIMGCVAVAMLLGLLVYSWVARAIEAFFALKGQDDVDIYVFAVPPVAWTAPLCLVLLLVETYFTPSPYQEMYFFALTIPFALSSASFPRTKKKPQADVNMT